MGFFGTANKSVNSLSASFNANRTSDELHVIQSNNAGYIAITSSHMLLSTETDAKEICIPANRPFTS